MDIESMKASQQSAEARGRSTWGQTFALTIAFLGLVSVSFWWNSSVTGVVWGHERADVLKVRDSPSMVNLPPRMNDRPVIGILSVPVENDSSCVSRRRLQEDNGAPKTSCFSSLYVKWVESMGGRVVPVQFDLPIEEIDVLLRSLNGFVFSGGDVLIQNVKQEYMVVARHILEYVKDQNDLGIYFPLWGTCMGIQTLSVLVGGPAVLEYHVFRGVDPSMLPIKVTPKAFQSRLFESTPRTIFNWLTTENVTTNYHHDGVDPSAFEENSALREFFNVLATNVDVNGKPFVSVIESKRYPIWGVQFHPERPQFEFNEGDDPVSHSLAAVTSNAWFSSFFVDQCTRNRQHFISQSEEHKSLIYNFSPSGSKAGQTYFF